MTAIKKLLTVVMVLCCSGASAQWLGGPGTLQRNTTTGEYRWLYGPVGAQTIFDPNTLFLKNQTAVAQSFGAWLVGSLKVSSLAAGTPSITNSGNSLDFAYGGVNYGSIYVGAAQHWYIAPTNNLHIGNVFSISQQYGEVTVESGKQFKINSATTETVLDDYDVVLRHKGNAGLNHVVSPANFDTKSFINLGDYLIQNTLDSLKWNAAKAAAVAKRVPIFVPAGTWTIPLNNQSNLMNGVPGIYGVGAQSILKTVAVTDSTSLLEWRGSRTLMASNVTVNAHSKQVTIGTGLSLTTGDIVFLITKDALTYYNGSNGFNGQRLIVDQYNATTGVVKFQTAFEFNTSTGYLYKNTPEVVTIRDLKLEAPTLSTLQGIVVSFGILNLNNVIINNFGTRGVNVSSSSGICINLTTSGGYYPSLESRVSGASYGIAVNDLSDYEIYGGIIAGGKHAFSQSYAGKARGWNKSAVGGGADTTMAFGANTKIFGGTYISNNDSLYSINQHGIGRSLEVYDATVYYGVAVGGKHYKQQGGILYGSSTDNTKQTVIIGTGHTDPNAPFGEYVFQDIAMNTSRPWLLDQAVNKLVIKNINTTPVGPVVTSHMFLQNALADTLIIDGLTHNGNVGDKAYYNFKVKTNNTTLRNITLNNSYLIVTSDNTDSLSVTADHIKVRGADKDGVKFTSTTGKVFLNATCDYCDVDGSVNSGVNMGQSSSVTVVRNAFVTNSPLKNNGTSGTNAYGFLATGANFVYAAGNDFTSTVYQKNAIKHSAPPSGTDTYVIRDNILLGQTVAPVSVSGTAVITFNNVTETGLELVNNFPNVIKVVNGGLGTSTAPTSGQIPIASSTTAYTPRTLSGDITVTSTGVTAIKNSVALAGIPTAPTATAGTNTTQIATMAALQTGLSGMSFNILQKTAAYTIVTGDFVAGKRLELIIQADATSAAFAVTLPAAASFTGYEITVKKKDASANAVTVTATIDGVTNYILASLNKYVTVYSDGTAWFIKANN